MPKLIKFLRLTAEDKYFLVKTAFLLATIRLGLWVLPFQTLCHLLSRWKGADTWGRNANPSSVNRIIWGINLMSSYVPAASCLTKALAALMLLGRNGQPACLRFGVAKGLQGELEAHAWVESQGRIVIGTRSDLPRYTMLSPTEKIVL